MRSLRLALLPGEHAILRFEADGPVPRWVTSALAGSAGLAGFVSVSRAPGELSVVAPVAAIPPEPAGAEPAGATPRSERGWRCLRVEGPFAFSEVGILAALSGALAGAGISLFAISTFDTDICLVREADLARSISALESAGHVVAQPAEAGR